MLTLKKILIACAFIVIAGGVLAFYMYNKKTVDTRTEDFRVAVTAEGITEDFDVNEDEANKKYLDKVILVKGEVTGVETDSSGKATVFLNSGDAISSVTCSFYETESDAVKALKPGDQVAIKGICTGKLIDVVFNKCSLVK